MIRPRAIVAILAVELAACSQRGTGKTDQAPALAAVVPAGAVPAAAPPSPQRFVAIGGGPTPESNEVSLEQDIDLVRKLLPAPGSVLFAGGGDSVSVRELLPAPRGDALLLALGDLFAPRNGRQSRYRRPRFAAEPATEGNIRARLSLALAESGPPLLVFIAAHGDQGDSAKNNAVALWGGGALTVTALAELHERYQRPLRLIATSCFSGGFAELAFARADASGGRPPSVARCGLFAGTADRETSGCDPNPDRREQESYALHFVSALAGRRKDGSALPAGAADYDKDGKIGLLDAHTWARIQAVSFDVPTTTSERWLESAEGGSAPLDPTLLPEDVAVVEHLGKALGVTNERAVQRRGSDLDRQITEASAALDQAEDELAQRDAALGAVLLARWPVLDDPFHPDFAGMLAEHREAIEQTLTASPEARQRAAAKDRTAPLYERLAALMIEEARVSRLERAYQTLHRAAALVKKGGPSASYYASLLACERGQP